MHRVSRLASCALVALSFAAVAGADPAISTVSLKSADGTVLKGTYFAADKPGPGLLLLHQCNRDRSAWAPFAKAAAASGFHVLTLDFRGFGESEGARFALNQEQQTVINEKWPQDVDAGFAFLTSRDGVDRSRIGAAGASCGVNQSVQLASRHPDVRALVLLSGGLTPASREHLQTSAPLPVFTAASLGDGNIVQTMRWIKELSGHPASRYVEYQAAGHGTDMFAVEKGLEPAVLEWLGTHLRNASTTAVQAQTPERKATDEFWAVLRTPGGAARARQIYDEAKRKDKAAFLFPEGELNQYGYEVLQEGRNKEAIIIFQMNVDEYPKSANVYDSLSDAYLADGNKVEALKFAEKAIQMLATDTEAPEEFKQQIRESAERKIAELKKK